MGNSEKPVRVNFESDFEYLRALNRWSAHERLREQAPAQVAAQAANFVRAAAETARLQEKLAAPVTQEALASLAERTSDYVGWGLATEDADWLIAEIKRLRGWA
jgi:hypothetical protein